MLNLKPAVPKIWLFGIAGVMWSMVGLMLIRSAAGWLLSIHFNNAWPFALTGTLSAIAAYKFGFSKIAMKNINRLYFLPEKPCMFAFQAWKSYLLIIFMIALGVTLRHSHLPKQYLSVIYSSIGGALLLSSIHYYMAIWKIRNTVDVKSGTPA